MNDLICFAVSESRASGAVRIVAQWLSTESTWDAYGDRCTAGGHDRQVGARPAGVALFGEQRPVPPATTDELLAQWRAALRAGERKLLDRIVAAYPAWRTRAWLAAQAGYEQSGGMFGVYLGALRRNGLIAQQGDQVRASTTLFFGVGA